MRFDTLLVQSGQRPAGGSGDVVPPLHLAATYERGVQDPVSYFYGRGENPTREALEECLATLEGVRFATTFGSGQAAAASLLSLVRPGQRVVAHHDLYSGTTALLELAAEGGVLVERADLSRAEVATAVLGPGRPPARLVWTETPSNPLLEITDLEQVSRLAHAAGALVVVDNTLASPALQQPLRWADVSCYSTTKSVSGHLDVIGGALVYDDEALHRQLRRHRTVAGNVPGPFDCYLVRRGLKTLSLRVARQCTSAAAVVTALAEEPAVGAIRYPGLPAHPGHEVAARQMSAYGSVVSFDYLGDAAKLLEAVRVFAPAVSLGGVQSLVEIPATMTHAAVAQEERERSGITDRLVRLSIGVEDPLDLVEDLRTALRAG